LDRTFYGGFALLGVLGAKFLVMITAPGFDAFTAGLATTLTMIMFPSVIFMGIGMLITGILNAKKHFAVAAFAPGFSSVIIIFSVLFFGQYGIHYLAWGTLLSMVGAMLIQIPILKKIGFHYYWDWNLRHPEVKGLFLTCCRFF
jgi:putative peptidoglycan lipid II flippase